jgi:hypothetical protein
VRTDVWSSLRENEDLDKCEQYVTDIQWSANELEEILAKKILSFVKRHELDSTIADSWAADRNQESLIELAFARRVSWGKSTVPPIHPIRILSARRPRWLAQLCRLAGAEAYRTLRTRIGMQEINTVLPGFGNLRISDLYKEHLHQFPDIKRLIECFALGPRRYRTADLQDRIARNYLAKVGTSNVPELDSASSPDARQLAHFVYKIGLIQGRAGGDSPTFVNYEDRPTLLTTSVNLDDGMLWEVYPSYRNALNIHKA